MSVSNPPTCTNILNINGISCTVDTVASKVTASGWSVAVAKSTSVQFKLGTVTNPSAQGTDPIQLRTYTTSAATYIIDQDLTTMVPTLACNQPCRTCDANDKSSCTSCYETGSFQYLQSSSCVAACSTGWINKGTFTCTQCDSVCATCDNNDETSCLTCDKTGSTPFFYNNRCLTECPSTMYSNSFICTDCVSPCASCSSASECTSCLNDGTNSLIYLQGN